MWKDIAYAVAIVIIVGWEIFREVKRVKQEDDYNLDPNPKRCMAHEAAIAAIQATLEGVKERLDRIEDRLK
jgi:hypothetical protein